MFPQQSGGPLGHVHNQTQHAIVRCLRDIERLHIDMISGQEFRNA